MINKMPRFILLLRKNAKGLEENLLLTYRSNKNSSTNFNWYKIAGVVPDNVLKKLPKDDLCKHENLVLDCVSPKFMSDKNYEKIRDFVLGVAYARTGTVRRIRTTIINAITREPISKEDKNGDG